MADHIRITKAEGRWSVRAGGAVLGESDAVLELSEGDYAPVMYFPRSDIAMAFMDLTEKVTHCPHKGDASHYSVVTKSNTLENAAWSYEAPFENVARIKDHVAFYADSGVTVEKL